MMDEVDEMDFMDAMDAAPALNITSEGRPNSARAPDSPE